MKKLIVVVDMQRFYVSGILGTFEAKKIVPVVAKKIQKCRNSGWSIAFLYDMSDGTSSVEGAPIPTAEYQLVPEIKDLVRPEDGTFVKEHQNSLELLSYVESNKFEQVEIIGVCTNHCVMANALYLITSRPTLKVAVDPACCAGTSPSEHHQAIREMHQQGIWIRKRKKK